MEQLLGNYCRARGWNEKGEPMPEELTRHFLCAVVSRAMNV
jgi:hypothetical protein